MNYEKEGVFKNSVFVHNFFFRFLLLILFFLFSLSSVGSDEGETKIR